MAEKNTDIEARISSLETKFEMFMREMSDFKQEMRDRDNQRAEDIREMRKKHDSDMKEMNQRFYSKFDAMDAKVDANFKEFAKQLHSNFVQTMIGVGAIMAAIGGLLIAALKLLVGSKAGDFS